MTSSRKIQSLKDTLKSIKKELKAISQFRRTNQLEQFRRRLVGEYSYVKRQIDLYEKHEKTTTQAKKEKLRKANRNRSEKNKRNWRYAQSVQKNYAPDKTVMEVRSLLKKRKEGLEVDISDVAWRNPSP